MSFQPLNATYNDHKAYNRELDSRKTWVYWTIVGASLLLCLIVVVTLYDIICRFREKLRSQHIFDGGPPATPSHSFHYTVGIKADIASASFDTNMTVIKVELLDNLNRYVTTIAVPCFLLKFRKDKTWKSKTNSKTITQSVDCEKQLSQPPNLPQTQQQPIQNQSQSQPNPMQIKSLSLLQEQWSGTVRGELVSFQLTRRRPLQNITSARISHDCYVKDAFMVLKYVTIYDQIAKINFMIDLKEKQIRAPHPCPPSAFQVYPAERVDYHEDLKSFIDLTRNRYTFYCPCIKT